MSGRLLVGDGDVVVVVVVREVCYGSVGVFGLARTGPRPIAKPTDSTDVTDSLHVEELVHVAARVAALRDPLETVDVEVALEQREAKGRGGKGREGEGLGEEGIWGGKYRKVCDRKGRN